MDRLRAIQRHVASPATGPIDFLSLRKVSSFRPLPRFDSHVMERLIDDLWEFKHSIYELLAGDRIAFPDLIEGLRKEEHRATVRQLLLTVLAAGHSPLAYFQQDLKKYFYLGELLSLVDLSLTVKMGVQYSLWGGSVMNLGTEKHKQQYFEAINSFELPGCFAMTEVHHGSNVAALQTQAVFDIDTDDWIIDTPDDGAIKWWIGNAAEDGVIATVFARLKVPASDGSGALADHGVHAFVVPLRDPQSKHPLPGVEIRDNGYKAGLNGVDNGSLRFTGVRVPRGNLLDKFGEVDRNGHYSSSYSPSKRFAATLGELTGGRVGLTCASVGILKNEIAFAEILGAQGSLTVAIRYGSTRHQFGPPGSPEIAVLDYTSQQLKLMPMLASCYALHFTGQYLVQQYAEMKVTKEEDLVADVHALSAGLKAYTTSFTAKSISTCRECCGGHGYAASSRFGSWRSDHDIFQTFEGDNTVLLQQVAGFLLKKYKERFATAPVKATYRYLQQWASDTLPANPVVAHDTDIGHLRNPSFLVHALRYRTARLLHTVALRLNKHTRRHGAFQAWNRCLNHLLALATAHIESLMLDSFLQNVNKCQDAGCRQALKAMSDLFALSRIHADIMFRNDDYVAKEKAKAIQRLIEALCKELRSVAVLLVDAFAIPDHILRSPIGLKASSADPYAEYLQSIGWA